MSNMTYMYIIYYKALLPGPKNTNFWQYTDDTSSQLHILVLRVVKNRKISKF